MNGHGPLVGLPLGSGHDRAGRPRLHLNRAYVSALQQAGADVVLLPPGRPGVPPALLDRLDGILFPGGADVHPRRYGEAPRDCLGEVDEDLDALEVPLAREAAGRGIVVLGICRGQQVVNVALGGTLWQDVRADGLTAVDHAIPVERGRDFLAHGIDVVPGTWLGRTLGSGRLEVNSFHHQAVRQVAPGLRVSARSDDGVIEGLESADGRTLAIQCHPEELTAHAWARDLFRAFVELAAGVRAEPVGV